MRTFRIDTPRFSQVVGKDAYRGLNALSKQHTVRTVVEKKDFQTTDGNKVLIIELNGQIHTTTEPYRFSYT
jgi:hypothetical protein